MRSFVFASAMIAAALAVVPARAGQMAVGQLVKVENRAACMARAGQMLLRYRDAHGASVIREDQWVIYMWNAEGEGYDVVVMCPEAVDGVAGLVVIHGPDEGDSLGVLKRISENW